MNIFEQIYPAQSKLFNFTESELRTMVWSKPLTVLASGLGMCDKTIARHCQAIGVSLPPRGFSQSHQLGDDLSASDREEMILRRQEWSQLTAEDLENLVSAAPATDIGAYFGISSSAVKKKCKKFGVPTKPRGYWR